MILPRYVPLDPYLGGKPIPAEWMRGTSKPGHASIVKAKRRSASKRARAARRTNR